ncbi:hypothetical protein ABH930_000702 [Kitasatospora sp. GAS204A]|uniref:hypothetical protein n=1 Tax=unclassified Kitasatospora TaxID=2633591 RepID=UPI002476E823|nr:hypothetical protein [Kitasatospora sp. GAS204B]MDH6116303.1 hypothetical protein [Kitasatospora sp. GAS204B]
MTGNGGEQAQQPTEGPRHAAPRVSGRKRARLLAFTAVPTALLMGSTVLPELASAATTAGTSCAPAANAPVTITQVPKSQLTPVPNPSPTTASASPTTAPTSPTKTAASPTKASASGTGQVASGTGQQVGAAFVPPTAGPTASPGAQQQAAAAVTSHVVQADDSSGSGGGLLGDIINGITGIFDPNHQNQPQPKSTPSTPPPAAPQVGAPVTPSTPATAQPGTPAAGTPAAPVTPAPATPSGTPSSTPSSTTGKTPSASSSASPSSAPSTAPSGSPAPSGAAGPAAVASALANGDTRPLCPVDTSKVAAATVPGGQVVPDQNWTLKTTRLALHGAVFGGVYEVHSPTGTKRVLKFTVSAVDIDNLDMSTLENTGYGNTPPQTFHVKGAPGSTSTMVNGPITMYVESLSGELSALYGIPLPPLGTITLTPDTLPTWLYDLIGLVPIPLDITMTGVTAVQAGQFGGTLTIPGMHMYNDTEPYPYGH